MADHPTTFTLQYLGLPFFCRVRYAWDAHHRQLAYSRTGDGEEETRTAQPDPAAWESFRLILDKLRAWEWQAHYPNPGVLDGEHWSLTLGWGDRRLYAGGDNAYPPGFAVFRQAVNGLMDGSLPLYARSLLDAAESAAQAHAGPEAALRELMQQLEFPEGLWLPEGQQALLDLVQLLGVQALPAVPRLLDAWAREGLSLLYLVRDALDHIARAAEGLDADPEEVRRLGKPAVPAILPLLNRPETDAKVREILVRLLRRLDRANEGAVRAAVANLQTQDIRLFDTAFYFLEECGARPPEAIPLLLTTLKERIDAGNWAFSEQIVRALVRLFGPAEAVRALPLLLEALQHAPPDGRVVAASNLGALGPPARPAVPLLLAALADPYDTLRWQAVEALGAIGPEARDAGPALLALFHDPTEVVRNRVPRALAQILPDSSAIIEPLVNALRDDSEQVRHEAGRVLGTLGPNFPDLGDVPTIVGYVSQRTLERKLRLFAVACCRAQWDVLTDERGRHAVAVAERVADGEAGPGDLAGALGAARAALAACRGGRQERTALAAACWAAAPLPGATQELTEIVSAIEDQTTVRQLAYELLFDYSFLPATYLRRAWLEWKGGVVSALARTIYDERRFEDLPVLADALEEAGCADELILGHCRQRRLHARGCRVLDAVLRGENFYIEQ